MHHLLQNGSNSKHSTKTLKNSEEQSLQIQEIIKEGQNQQTEPTIRSEI